MNIAVHEYEARLARVEDLMIQGYSAGEIARKMVSEEWCDSEKTAATWRHKVLKRWAEEDAVLRPHRKNLWRARLEGRMRRIDARLEASGITAFESVGLEAEWTKIAKVAIALDGLMAPVTVKIEGGLVEPIAMTPAERDAEIKQLLEKREQMRKPESGGN